jgi:SAM-dependent methyltransferase
MLNCPVCGSSTLMPLTQRQHVPCHQNLLSRTRDEALKVQTGKLAIQLCRQCGFAHNAAFNPALLAYGENYENAQDHSPAFQAHVASRMKHLLSGQVCRNQRIVEVGCGQGQLLKQLVADEEAGNVGFGFDPSYQGPETLYNGRLRFFKSFYNEDCADIPADIILCRHVIEHVPDPLGLLQTIRKALIHSPHARLFFETPDLDWILKNQVIWDFFYEHCSYFTRYSLATCFELAGFEVLSVSNVFEGQYLWLEAQLKAQPGSVRYQPEPTCTLGSRYQKAEQDLILEWQRRLEALRANGPIALWGAGAKGATFAHLLDPDCKRIACVIDINPNKQDAFIPGTAHPIIAPSQAPAWGIQSVILMNPNYLVENQAMMAEFLPNLHWEVPRDVSELASVKA